MKTKIWFAAIAVFFAIGLFAASGAKSSSDKFSWGLMMQLGHNMWGEGPLTGEPATEAEKDRYARDFNRTDEKLWYEVTEYAAKKGVNMLLIDLGEGMVYPSHPELAVKGSWSQEKLAAEIAKIRRLGLKPVPKLNFSTMHDQWLKIYNRMIGLTKYYEVCRDVIGDVCDIFGKPELFHIGMDGECLEQKRNFSGYGTFRDRTFWFQDVKFYAEVLEKRGVRAWMWADAADDWPEEYVAECPKTILQSVASYRNPIDVVKSAKVKPVIKAREKTLKLLDDAGFEIVLSGLGDENNPGSALSEFMAYSRAQNFKHIVGGIQTSWNFLLPGGNGEKANMESVKRLKEAIKVWNA
jgi:hypothetical protein